LWEQNPKTPTLSNPKGSATRKSQTSPSALTYLSGIIQPCAFVNGKNTKGWSTRETLTETDANGNTNEYVFFRGKRIALRDSSNNVFYYFADQLGTAREIIQAGSTSPCYDADFYPFGGERIAKDSQGHPIDSCDSHYKFTGKERDSESGLDNFGARYDSSQYGRFMSPDPIWVKVDRMLDPQRLNLYAYVRNNPLKFTDPTGMRLELSNCPGSMTTTMCEAAVRNGLSKPDRDHVHFVEGNGKNGYKKGEVGILVDANFHSQSLNFNTLQSLANDQSALGRINILDANDTYSFRTELSYPPKGLTTHSSKASDFAGYTFFQFRGKEEAGIMYSTGDYSDVFVDAQDPTLDVSTSIYHELQHVFLGDFGRTATKAKHGLPEVDKRTKAAQDEAKTNEQQ
jgi:RHS repeat-associated protein